MISPEKVNQNKQAIVILDSSLVLEFKRKQNEENAKKKPTHEEDDVIVLDDSIVLLNSSVEFVSEVKADPVINAKMQKLKDEKRRLEANLQRMIKEKEEVGKQAEYFDKWVIDEMEKIKAADVGAFASELESFVFNEKND